MALLMPFTDASGAQHDAAHWRVVQINIGAADRAIYVVFAGYLSAGAFAAGRQPLPGAAKSYGIAGAEFLAVAGAAPVGSTLYDVLADACESHAMAKLDTPTGEVDGDGRPVLRSFFAGATRD